MLYSLGLGASLVAPMTTTLIGLYYPVEKRTGALGSVMGVGQILIPGIIGIPLIGFLAGIGGWRFTFLAIAVPLSLLSAVMIARAIPAASTHQREMGIRGLFAGYKTVFSNRSTIACLAGIALASAAWQFYLTYGAAFMRQAFGLSLNQVTMYLVGVTSCAFLGSLLASRFVSRFGRKQSTVITILVMGAFIVAHYVASVLWLTIVCSLICAVFGAIVIVSRVSLALEQAPEYRGTMMALNGAVNGVGGVIGAGVGGVILSTLASYAFVGVASLAIGLIAAAIFHFLVIDPTRTVM